MSRRESRTTLETIEVRCRIMRRRSRSTRRTHSAAAMAKRAPGLGPALTRWSGSEARRADKVNYCFGLARRGHVLSLPIKLTLRYGRHRLDESGGPPPFAPSLKFQGNAPHNQLRVVSRQQLPGAVGMPIGTSVSRIGTELIFRRCWIMNTAGCWQGVPPMSGD